MPSKTFPLPQPSFLQTVAHTLVRWRVWWIILLAALFLSGCVQYDVEIKVDGANRGEILQHIRLDDRLTAFSQASAQQWLDSIDRRTQNLDGKVRRLSDREVLVTIPFSSNTELETKFNEFFHPTTKENVRSQAGDIELPNLVSQLHLTQNNFFLVQRAKLSYDLDLRALGVLAADGNLLISPGSLLDLTFRLKTPWGAHNLLPPNRVNNRDLAKANPTIAVQQDGHYLVWTLQPGQINHLEAAFWLPSPLGVGALVIIGLVLAGSYVKYRYRAS